MQLKKSLWLKCTALLSLFTFSTSAVAMAQAAQGTGAGRDAASFPGTTVWIADSSKREEATPVVDDIVTSASYTQFQRFSTSRVAPASVRESDPLWNGALIGAGVGVASGLFLCTRTEPWENCRDDVGPMLRIGALGAGIGIAIDALIRGRKTVSDASPGTMRMYAAPVVGRRAGGLHLALSF